MEDSSQKIEKLNAAVLSLQSAVTTLTDGSFYPWEDINKGLCRDLIKMIMIIQYEAVDEKLKINKGVKNND